MQKYLTVMASFVVMLCIGSLYAWSIIAAELIEDYGFSAIQSQVIFGTLIAVFPITMILVGQLSRKMQYRFLGFISGILFALGYIVASFSQGNFIVILMGMGVLAGIGTGFGYWVALTSPVLSFPKRKGLIAGIAAAGFGLGAVFMSEISEVILNNGYDVLQLLAIMGIAYGLLILIASNYIYQAQSQSVGSAASPKLRNFIKTKPFVRLFLGVFLGTYAGLLIIGSLRIIGGQYGITTHVLILGVALFAVANFLGRLIWGFLSDYIGANLSIFLALLFQSIAIIGLNVITLSDAPYLILSFLIGFGFGGNFVLFAKETAQIFGLNNLGIIYPYVFIGYAIAGITGPLSGGLLYDYSGSYSSAILLASLVSLMGSLLFLYQFIAHRSQRSV